MPQLAPVHNLACYQLSLETNCASCSSSSVSANASQTLCGKRKFGHSVVKLWLLQQEAVTLLESADGDGAVALDAEEDAGSGEEVEAEQAARDLLGLPGLNTCRPYMLLAPCYAAICRIICKSIDLVTWCICRIACRFVCRIRHAAYLHIHNQLVCCMHLAL